MGQALAETVTAAADLELAGVWRRGEDLTRIIADADVLIDFSLPEATELVIEAARQSKTPLVCGVSGMDAQQLAALEAAAEEIPVVYDRNMSLGIAVLTRLAGQAATGLGSGFAIEVHETHHVHKKDAPSGTALKLGEAIAATAGLDEAAIHYESERRGEVPGEHTVVFRSPTETVTLGHSVTTRQVFVDGALRAARWIADQGPGRYRMTDVLNVLAS